jgi:hypothetical protein
MPTEEQIQEKSEVLARKAKCFDLVMQGNCTGMSLFYERFARMQELQKTAGDSAVLGAMARLACEEAMRLTFEDGFDVQEPRKGDHAHGA